MNHQLFFFFFIYIGFQIPSKEHIQYNNYANPLQNKTICHDQKNE